jgi:hypothetical protein
MWRAVPRRSVGTRMVSRGARPGISMSEMAAPGEPPGTGVDPTERIVTRMDEVNLGGKVTTFAEPRARAAVTVEPSEKRRATLWMSRSHQASGCVIDNVDSNLGLVNLAWIHCPEGFDPDPTSHHVPASPSKAFAGRYCGLVPKVPP